MSFQRPSVPKIRDHDIFIDPATPTTPTAESARELERRLSNVNTVTAVTATPIDTRDADTADIPDGGYGWVCVACIFLVNGNTWGANSAYSVFLAYFLLHETYPSTSPLIYALIGGLSISQALLISPLTVYTNHRFGIRTTLLLGTVLESLALILASFSTKIWHLILSQGFLFGYGMGFLYVGSAGLISQWFLRKRSLAQGIVTAGAGVGGFIYSLLTGSLLPRIGLAWTFRVLAISTLACNLLASFLARDRDAAIKPTAQSFNIRLFLRLDFLLLLGWGCITDLGYITVYYSLPDFASTIGLSSKQGSVINSLLSLAAAFGRLLVGYLSDRYGRINVSAAATFYCSLLCLLLWIFAKGFAALAVFALLAGMVCGNFWANCAPVTAEVVGLRELPDTLATLWLVLAFPTIVAEPIALQLRRQTGNIYLPTQLFAGFAYLLGGCCLWLLRPRAVMRLEAERRKREDQPALELTTLHLGDGAEGGGGGRGVGGTREKAKARMGRLLSGLVVPRRV